MILRENLLENKENEMTVILIVTILIILVLTVWCWHNLGNIENYKKILYIIVGSIIMLIITNIIFQISKSSVNYENEQIEATIGNILIFIFTGFNALISLPYIARQFDKIHEQEITKQEFTKKMTIMIILFVVCLFFECGYLTGTQQGILNIYHSLR